MQDKFFSDLVYNTKQLPIVTIMSKSIYLYNFKSINSSDRCDNSGSQIIGMLISDK